MGKARHTVQSGQMENYNLGLKDANSKILKKTAQHGIKSHKCNQCDYASSHAGHLAIRAHLKMRSGEKSNKCNQCDYISFEASNLRRHLEMHCGEKFNNEIIHHLCSMFDETFQNMHR